jgi:NAD-dependent SIR2 family protein deacetylase
VSSSAIVALEQRGKLHGLITQNIDGLHLRAGHSPHLVIEVIERAMRSARETDLLLAVGTSLQVYPVAGAAPLAKAAGAKVVIINAQATQFDSIADAVLPAPISEILPRICGDDGGVIGSAG